MLQNRASLHAHTLWFPQGKTGFPWIDATMVQLQQEGWIHHLARHAVGCFLTRGDLFISWEEGMKVILSEFYSLSQTQLIENHTLPSQKKKTHSLYTGVSLGTITPSPHHHWKYWLQWFYCIKQVFERWLLDAEWSVNAGNWMWLSCSAFFQQFFNCICPVGFGRKLDPNGDYIRLV